MKTVYLNRVIMDNDLTLGNLLVGVWSCYTIERPWLNNRLSVSCIPEGTYVCRWGYYNKGGYPVFELQDVVGRTQIKIHAANFADEVAGCIALGSGVFASDSRIGVSGSRNALNDFHASVGHDDLFMVVRDRR